MTDKSLSSDECARLRQARAEGIASDNIGLLDFAELKAEARRRLAISAAVPMHDPAAWHRITKRFTKKS